jgi:hypothetical protein
MDDLFIACILTICCLLTMVFTSPGGYTPGFKLKAALALGAIGMGLTFILKFELWAGVEVIESRVETMMCVWMVMGWLVILCPYSKRVKTRLDELRKTYG